jgi:sucrose phosphorylase
VHDRVELITYADRLAPTIGGLADLLDGPLAGLFGGVHLLPFFIPVDGADAGFDPDDHRAVDPRVGSWDDVRRLASRVAVTADLVVNHISARSEPFLDVLAHGDASPFADMFLTFASVFPRGATEADLLAIYRPRPGLPFTARTLADGSKRLFWTTFTSEQIDLDFDRRPAMEYVESVLDTLRDHGVTTVRLDAVGYAVKRAGTSCLMLPETFDLIDRLGERAHARGLEVLVELHSHYRLQLAIAPHVDRVYDFALPPLVLHACFTGDVRPLARWLEIRPPNCVTVLDTHDGIGVVDVAPSSGREPDDGLLGATEIAALVGGIHERSSGASRLATGGGASSLDVYQVNCTFYDALGGDDARYLLARLVQLLLPGRPQIYYVGLLAGRNDTDLLARTGTGRDVNRHRFSRDEIDDATRRPIVRALFHAIRLRNTHVAFGGEFSWSVNGRSRLTLRWAGGGGSIELAADFARGAFVLDVDGPGGAASYTSVADLSARATSSVWARGWAAWDSNPEPAD